MEGSIGMSFYGEEKAKVTQTNVRCTTCNKLLAEQVSIPWAIRCARCKHLNVGSLTDTEPAELPSASN